MELKALSRAILITSLLAVWLLLWVVSEQSDHHRASNTHGETGVVCLTCDYR